MKHIFLISFLFLGSTAYAAKNSESSVEHKVTCEIQLKSSYLMLNRTSIGSSPRLECAKREVIDIDGKNVCTEELNEIFKGDGKVYYKVKDWEDCFATASEIAKALDYSYSYPTDRSPAKRWLFVKWKYKNKNSKKLRAGQPSKVTGKLNSLSSLHHEDPVKGDLRYEDEGGPFIVPLF